MTAAATLLPPRLPPPAHSDHLLWRVQRACFSSFSNTCLTLLSLLLVWWLTSATVQWVFLNGVFEGDSREACADGGGMCWPFIAAKLEQWVYGRYPQHLRWRVDVWLGLVAAAALWMTLPHMPRKKFVGWAVVLTYAPLSLLLLYGGALGLEEVETPLWGGVMLTLVVAITGNIVSLPLALPLALGRRADHLPVVKAFCVSFIELMRGVPFITMLFMMSVMLPLFLPEGATVDKLLRALLAVTVFQAAYLAEVVRGGLQALPNGQEEGAKSLGLSYWRTMRLVVLPQALTISIPGVANSYIALLKDTTLVLIIGLFDLLGMVQLTTKDPQWIAPTTVESGYLFVAAFFWVLCFGMSRYSRALEKKLHVEHGEVR